VRKKNKRRTIGIAKDEPAVTIPTVIPTIYPDHPWTHDGEMSALLRFVIHEKGW
jgi:hypothetical protein